MVVVSMDPGPSSPPRRKRARVDHDRSQKNLQQQPRLFAPFRALGLITNDVPFVMQTRSHKGATEGPRIHLVTCLGRSWAMWEGGRMGLLFVGPDAPERISCLATEGNTVWAASGPHLIQYLRGMEVGRLTNPLETNMTCILVLGSQLLALTEDGTRLLAWDIGNGELQTNIQFDPNFTATTMLHPATYLNKVLIGSSQGDMQLWNVRTQTTIHTFPLSSLTTRSQKLAKQQSIAITALVQSPAIDVVGVGFASGEISVYDVRVDERLMKMSMQDGAIRALSFRSDGHSVLASASSNGHITLWDLSSGGQLLHLMRGAHDGAVTNVEWVPGQPLLISSGDDNSVKQWFFESSTSPPCLLKYRSGHHNPPHLIRYYGDDGKQLLTASTDRSLRCTSVVRDSRGFEFSQGSLSKKATSLSIPLASLKFPPVIAVAHSTTRTRDWDDILTAHAEETFARTWTMKDKKLGKHVFGFGDGGKKGAPVGAVTAVCVSTCGNFALTASSTGAVYMYNIQSGILRKTFSVGPCPPAAAGRSRASSSTKSKGQDRCMTGLATDALNSVVIASTLDGTVIFFDFHTANLEKTLVLPCSALSMTIHRDSGLLAVICDDHAVRLVDVETRKIVRELRGHRGRVLDLTFSPDSRWLVTTSLDSLIRTFDIPTGRLIDAFRTSSVATSVAFSPTNDFLATSHTDSVGVYLWANRAQYSDVSFQTVNDAEDVTDVALPSMQGVAEDEALEALSSLTLAGQEKPTDVFLVPPHLDGDLVTLSLLPRSRWQTLLNFEVIQQRNKPKEPPKELDKAPFFLPTLSGVEPRFVIQDQRPDEGKSKKQTKRLQKAAGASESSFHKRLADAHSSDDYEELFVYAKTLSPAAMDLELRSLVTLDDIRMFLAALSARLKSHRDFEAVQTYQNIFLQMNGDIIMGNPEVLQELDTLQAVQQRESQSLLELLASSMGTLSFIRDTM